LMPLPTVARRAKVGDASYLMPSHSESILNVSIVG
jgi:hypothetical protein